MNCFVNQSSARITRTIILSLFFITGMFSLITAAADPNRVGWEKLIDNKPFEAQSIFRENLSSGNRVVVGGAYRGLAFASKFLGDYDSTTTFLFKAFLTDNDTTLLNAAWINIIAFGRESTGHIIKEGYIVLDALTRTPSLGNGEYTSLLIDRFVNDGNLAKAQKLVNTMGIVRAFRMIGPFDNISGSGYKKVYPPETVINFSEKYTGKDGAEAPWFPFYNEKINGWVFTEYNYTTPNTVLYYYTNVHSNIEQQVNLGFGASGAFKVILNDNLVLADSVFRNTGTDMFMQKVRLFKGDNKLLIKLCQESRYANFLVRFVDNQGQPVPTITCDNATGSFSRDTTAFINLTNSPATVFLEKKLRKRIEQDENDHEAAVLLMDFFNASELTDKGQALAKKTLKRFPNSSLWHGLYSDSL